MYQDTIVAIATPIGEGGIGIVRLSGGEARAIAAQVFPHRLEDRRMVYGHIVDPESGEVIDEALACYMAAPHSYTREDVVELNCHGGPLPLQRVLGLVLRYGARLAQPGEFTLRAFLNGRIDLAQAEAVLDVVRAKTAAGLRVAARGLGGGLSRSVREVRAEVMAALASLTARIDFPDDEVEEQDVCPVLERALGAIAGLVASADQGMVYRQGVRTAIVGRPNVGKSSLLNCLLREGRAIVTPHPGTTRDTLEEVVNIRGVPFCLVDTAGITESKDLVESLGVERSRRAVEQADFVLLVVDAHQPLQAADGDIIDLLHGKEVLVVANKRDLGVVAALDHLPWERVSTSALTGEGLDRLEERMVAAVLGGEAVASDALLVANPRHKAALEQAAAYLEGALSGVAQGVPDDLVTIDLTAAANALGEITGETVSDELLETIFSRFCIGK
ncbi:MAG: tRNA uridine-5-carboxymethylaminomethyl(34) synthesis GTPase MnmE [Chloroflexota bacterium]|nr:tRNA uridine-5-carboxymethylaminomethyl(34) synthesis GTPase MnmE [Chloroflexota bacterium]